MNSRQGAICWRLLSAVQGADAIPQALQWQLLIALIFGFATACWMLAPLCTRVQVLRLPKRLAIVDVLGLMVLLQCAAAIYAPFHGQESLVPFRPFIAVVSLLFVLALWGASICVATQAGITHSLRRVAVMLVLVPGALVVMVTPCLLLVWMHLVGKANAVLLGSPKFLLGVVIVVLTATSLRYLVWWAVRSSSATVPEGRLA